jgi:hypothetical protein
MTVSVTLSFSSVDEMTSFFAGKSAAPTAAPAPAATTKTKVADTPRTAEPTPEPAAAAPAAKELDFDKDVVPALKAFATKDKGKFAALMKQHNLAKVTDLQSQPAIWAEVVAACNA